MLNFAYLYYAALNKITANWDMKLQELELSNND